MPRKNSKLRSLPKEELEKLVIESTSMSQILRYFGMENKGSNRKTLKRVLTDFGIDSSHIKKGINSNKGRIFGPKKSIEERLVENSTSNRKYVKQGCLESGLLKNVCYECGLNPEWNNKKLVLVLDHINGIYNDNRLENLRILCPNCHSQTETFAGRNKKKDITG